MRLPTVVAIALVIVGCFGCSQRHSGGVTVLQAATDSPRVLVPQALLEGDVVRPFFWRRPGTRVAAYLLAPGDEVRVTVAHRDDLTFTGRLLPDGTVTLPLVGSVPLASRGADAAAAELTTRYRQHLPDAAVNLLVLAADGEFTRLFTDLAAMNHRDDQAAELAVIDGSVHLPGIGPVPAAGRTVAEVERDAQARYEQAMPGVGLTLAPGRQRERWIAVLGEVRGGGRFAVTRPLPLLAALAQAGGASDRADLGQVVVAEPLPDGAVRVRVLDIEPTLEGREATGWLTEVPAGGVVYVPRTGIADVNLFVSQWIRNVLPIDVGYSLVQPVDVGRP